ncbi:MAG: hypothetical protein RLZ44_1034 [Pseudomonadota bacterium]
MSHKPRPIGNLLRQEGLLKCLQSELDQQTALLHRLRALLPSAARPHLVAARLHQHKLILYADTPAWVTRLRFQAPQLRAAAAENSHQISELKIRIHIPERAGIKPQPARLSAAAATAIREGAAGIDDPQLRAALQRLARS